MSYKVVISEDARNSILESMRFLANVNKIAAQKETECIFNKIKTLIDFPFSHPSIENLSILGNKVYKFVMPEGRYIVLYKIINSAVYVDKFLDSRKENKLFNDLIEK